MLAFGINHYSEKPTFHPILSAVTDENGPRLDELLFGPRTPVPTDMSPINASPLPLS